MPHQRQVIRAAVVELLLGQTAAGARVAATRMLPYRKNELPAISVYSLEETVDAESAETAPRELSRKLKLEIAGWVLVGEPIGVDDAMDALALEIETAMHADPYLGGAAADSILDTTALGIRVEGDTKMGLVTLSYAVTYQTLAPEEPAALDDFLTVDARHRIEGITDPVQDGHDTFIVQEATP